MIKDNEKILTIKNPFGFDKLSKTLIKDLNIPKKKFMELSYQKRFLVIPKKREDEIKNKLKKYNNISVL